MRKSSSFLSLLVRLVPLVGFLKPSNPYLLPTSTFQHPTRCLSDRGEHIYGVRPHASRRYINLENANDPNGETSGTNVVSHVEKDNRINPYSYGETSRKYRRTFYSQNDWVKHRSAERFLHVASTWKSGVVRQLAKEVTVVTGTAAFVVLFNTLFVIGFDDFQGMHHDPIWTFPYPLELPIIPFTLSSPALGLLLVFRTNSSYSRWKDARKAWGTIVNHSRTIMRLGSCWSLPDTSTKPTKDALEKLANAVWAFSRSLRRHLLRSDEDEEAYKQDVKRRLPPELSQALIDSRHRPTRALYEISCAVRDLPLDSFQRGQVEKSVTALCDSCGSCERILSSPVPLVYTRHTERFLAGWIILLPLALWEPFAPTWNHWGVIPASIMISFFLLGIEELAIQLEEPLSILPIQNLVDGIELSVDEHVEWNSDNRA